MCKLGKKQEQKKKILKIKIILFLVICVAVLATLPFSGLIESKINSKQTENIGDFAAIIEKDCVVHVIDVGCADCIALELPDGKKGLVDFGVDTNSKVKSTYQQNSVNYIKQYVFDGEENGKFDFVVLTHPHDDHYNNFKLIFDSFQIEKVYRPPVFYNIRSGKDSATKPLDERTQKEVNLAKAKGFTGMLNSEQTEFNLSNKNLVGTQSFAKCLDAIESEGSEVVLSFGTVDDIISSDSSKPYTIKFYQPSVTNYTNINSYSTLLCLTYNGHSIMLTGDATKESEKNILNAYIGENALPEVDVLKVAHHGSNTSSSVEFLNKVKPKYAFISTRTDTNKYNLPKQEILDRIVACGVSEDHILQTQNSGNLVFAVDDANMYIGATSEVVIATIKWWYVCGGIIILTGAVIFGVNIKTAKRK